MIVHIGFDDMDSLSGGCTSYICALIIERISRLRVRFLDYPNLIRLNPNVPWKTKGNGAICLRVETDEELRDLEEAVVGLVEENADLEDPRTSPGIVFLPGEVPREVEEFSERALFDLVKLSSAIKLVRDNGGEAIGLKGGRGIVGGLAAIGNRLLSDHTFEMIAYRARENYGKRRLVDPESVEKMDRLTRPMTFNNLDRESGRVLITPRGPDPVLVGIRGESPDILFDAFSKVKIGEPVERWVLFRTNQGTDAHLRVDFRIVELKPFRSACIKGIVSSPPKVIEGGHVIFKLSNGSGEIDCAAYEPSGDLNRVARKLIVGDLIKAYGGVRRASRAHPRTMNLEKIEILELARVLEFRNPKCPSCGRGMESAGRGQGYRCRRCKTEAKEKVAFEVPRAISPGTYLASPRAHRHLTKPLSRYGLEKGSWAPSPPGPFFGLGPPPARIPRWPLGGCQPI
ncbi:MAG: tRNA(Ile)(2)-agmatinylcytidine synthase [Candidatus Bathyarchaeia archaeon]